MDEVKYYDDDDGNDGNKSKKIQRNELSLFRKLCYAFGGMLVIKKFFCIF
jgi:hypothetical protein